jgi:DNA sulfur modification protein DndC
MTESSGVPASSGELLQLEPRRDVLARASACSRTSTNVVEPLSGLVAAQGDRELKELYATAQANFDRAWALNVPRWVSTFSGGKDSTLVTLLAVDYLLSKKPRPSLHVVYADTQMEIPAMRETAQAMLRYLRRIGRETGLQIKVTEVTPAVEESFWVCMIGRGYPPPKPKFRWCTRRLKITPAEDIVSNGERTAVLTGVRYGESVQRTGRLLASCATGGECGQDFWFKKSGEDPNVTYVAPIVNWRTCKVWDFLTFIAPAGGWPTERVVGLYGDTNMRFGCWTCTLVRRDKTMEALVDREPESPLRLLHQFRNEILEESALRRNRLWRKDKRPGGGHWGPLRISFRRDLLARLSSLEENTRMPLISRAEKGEIQRIWAEYEAHKRGPKTRASRSAYRGQARPA